MLSADIVCVDADPRFRRMLSHRLACDDYRVSDYEAASLQTVFRNTGEPRVMLVGRAEPDRSSSWIDTVRAQSPDALVLPMVRPSLLRRGVGVGGGDGMFDRIVQDCQRRLIEGVAAAGLRRTLGYTLADLSIGLEPKRLETAKGPIELTRLEAGVLSALLQRPGEVLTRASLYEVALGRASQTDTNVIDVHICRLRTKLARASRTVRIETIRGHGYTLFIAPAMV